MISKEVYVEIAVLRKHGLSLRKIAQEVGCAVNTVRRQLTTQIELGGVDQPRYERKAARITKLAPHEAYLRERVNAAAPHGIPGTVLQQEIVAQGYQGGLSQLRRFLRKLRPAVVPEPLIRFETAAGLQLQVDWVEFRRGSKGDKGGQAHSALYAFCATLGYSRVSYVQFVTDMQVTTLIECHEQAFRHFGGVTRQVLYDNMKTVVIERDAYGEGEHRYHSGFLDYAKHSGFTIKLCRPYRAKTKGKVERFNGYLRRSFYIPLQSRLAQAGLTLDVVTANVEVARWLSDVANARIHGTTQEQPCVRLVHEVQHLQALPAPWRGEIAAARPQAARAEVAQVAKAAQVKPSTVVPPVSIALPVPAQHPLAVYDQLLLGQLCAVPVTPFTLAWQAWQAAHSHYAGARP